MKIAHIGGGEISESKFLMDQMQERGIDVVVVDFEKDVNYQSSIPERIIEYKRGPEIPLPTFYQSEGSKYLTQSEDGSGTRKPHLTNTQKRKRQAAKAARKARRKNRH